MNTPYAGFRKLNRIATGINKAISLLGTNVDLFTADFNTIEKLAHIIHLERNLRYRVENPDINAEAHAFICNLLLKIADNRPNVTGFLTKVRMFELLNNSWEGTRVINKPNLRYKLQCAYPQCFRYDATDVNDVKLNKLVSALAFNPPSVKNYPTQPNNIYTFLYTVIESKSFNYLALFGLISFITGSLYGYILYTGLKN